MSNAKLAICVPSFNRLEQAKHCVLSLLSQIGEFDVSIQVIDNGSDEDYAEGFAKNSVLCDAISHGRLSIIRNPFNIGMGANFMRSFEVADGDWLWMVADDDNLRINSIDLIMKAIKIHSEECSLITFCGIERESQADVKLLNTLEDFIDFNYASTEVFNKFLFITNSLYKLSSFRPLISVGYQYLNSFIPHFMMQIKYMHNNKCVVLSNNIVDYVVPKIGYSYSMVAGLGVGAPKHALMKIDPVHYNRFLRLFFPHNDYKVIIDLYYACKREANLHVCNYLAGNYLHYVAISRTALQMIALRCFVSLLRFPKFFEKLLCYGGLISSTLEKHLDEIKVRYS